MENLHAPWRIQYVLRPKQPGATESVFTRIARSNDDIENFVIYRGKTCYSCLNAFPYNGGHILVCPYREVPDFAALTDEEMLELIHQTRRSIDALKQTMKPHGFNVGVNLGQVAGAGIVEHLHIHIVPRWNGDTNFMPVVANTNVLPEALKDVAARLRTALNS
jgi:ATP adenylyltransferase